MSRRAGDSDVFDSSLDFKTTDFRQRPDLYRIGRGEQGVLLVEPYKGELLPHWRFKTVADCPVSRLLNRSTSASNRRRMSSTEDFIATSVELGPVSG